MRGQVGKASGGDRIPAELFQILKDDGMKVLHSIWPANLENSAVVTGLEVSFHSNPKERQWQRMFNGTIALISHASKVMFKIPQVRLQQYVNRELPDIQAGFRKGRGTRDQVANIRWYRKSKRNPDKYLLLLY